MSADPRRGTRFRVYDDAGEVGQAIYVGSWIVCEQGALRGFAGARLLCMKRGGRFPPALDVLDLPRFRVRTMRGDLFYEWEGKQGQ